MRWLVAMVLVVGCADSDDACELPAGYGAACSADVPCPAGWECITLAGSQAPACERICDHGCALSTANGPCECNLFETTAGETLGVCRCPLCE